MLTLYFLYHIAVTVGFEPVDYVVDENNGTVTVHVIFVSGTLEREICFQFSTVPGSAGLVLCRITRRLSIIVEPSPPHHHHFSSTLAGN